MDMVIDHLDQTEELHRQQTLKWCREVPGVDHAEDCRKRSRRRIAGIVESIRLIPTSNSNTLEVTIFDGTDRIIGVWLGRKAIPGVNLGSHLILEGTVGCFRRGPLQIINPAYELLPSG
ncbi:MAG: OB-fold nucleic acid binding domain-containing protein [Actinomycetota bacterium]